MRKTCYENDKKMKVIRGNHKPVIIRKIEESDYETISFEQRGKYFN